MRILIVFVALCFFLFGCITPYELRGVEQVDGILVVEGIITDDESIITLSRSRRLDDDRWAQDFVFGARVYVERDDGRLFPAELPDHNVWPPSYSIRNGKLDPNSRYRLRIEIDENGSSYLYFSEFSHPIITPEIDSIFWMKRGPRQPVTIHVATHSPDNEVLFYRWSFREDWEIQSEVFLDGFPFRCWNYSYSTEIMLGSAERTTFGRVTDIIHEISPSNNRLSVLYRIEVTQNAISRRAHTYFENIRQNAVQGGSIFAPTPSSLRGNIFSATDPNRHVIGFIEVSTTTQKRLYIRRGDGVFEPSFSECLRLWTFDEIYGDSCFPMPPDQCNPLEMGFVVYEDLPNSPTLYILKICVDCTYFGTEQRPYDWPN